ncbi:hypothetical protein [uncultured Aquimarina sp.]|uniref:hypothetical protein n=1 Tax=uncultured Aquimarina sp. TaxID=575652 RepID=UPI00262E0084|nr:hypothetical protein [uncultured Aquimarina sp.]
MRKLLIIVIILSTSFTYVHAQENEEQKKQSAFSIETNTTPWLFGGYALGINYKPEALKHWGFLVGIAGNADFSPFIVDVFKPQNRNKGIDWEVSQAYVVAIDYYLKENTNEGIYIGLFNFIFENELNKNGKQAEFTSHTVLARTGYRWYPGKQNQFYLNPWGGIGTEYKLNGEQTVSNTEWETSGFAYFISLNAGFTF